MPQTSKTPPSTPLTAYRSGRSPFAQLLAVILLGLAAPRALAQVEVTPPFVELKAGDVFRFEAKDLPAPAAAESKETRDWVWTVLDGPAECMDRERGILTAPWVGPGPRQLVVEVRSRSNPDLRAEALVQVTGDADSKQLAGLTLDPPSRGMKLLAGSLGGMAGKESKDQASAGFNGLGGLVRWSEHSYLATEPGGHCLRLVTAGGLVLPFCGQPGVGGFQDGLGRKARFNGPTHLAIEHATFGTRPRVLVADSGNHAIRVVDPTGAVRTLAGASGQAGYQDVPDAKHPGDALRARFSNPQGIVCDAKGNVYVADQGNCVIRVIRPDGRVETVAGVPGKPLSAAGGASSTRFSRLKGMAMDLFGNLVVLDGHAVRTVILAKDPRLTLVTTRFGQVLEPGRNVYEGPQAKGAPKDGYDPCLNDPVGIAVAGGELRTLENGQQVLVGQKIYLTDGGNHCVRVVPYTPSDTAVPSTLVGDWRQDENRLGCLREDLPALEGDPGAALRAPGPILVLGGGELLVGTESGLFRISDPPAGAIQATLAAPEPTIQARAGEPWKLRFTPTGTGPDGQPDTRPVRYWAEFKNADGTVAWRQAGETRGRRQTTVEGRFTRAGKGSVALHLVQADGLKVSVQRPCQVSYEQAAPWAERKVVVLPAEVCLAAGEKITFVAQTTGTGWEAPVPGEGKEAKETKAAPASPWRWQAWDLDSGKPVPMDAQLSAFHGKEVPGPAVPGGFTARDGRRVRRIRIRATHRGDAGLWAEATATVLPRHVMLVDQNGQGPGRRIKEFLGMDWSAPAGTRPFLDIRDPGVARAFRPDPRLAPDAMAAPWVQVAPEAVRDYLECKLPRLGPGGRIERSPLPVLENEVQYAGYGRPRSLEWTAQPGADGQMLTLLGPHRERERKDVTGQGLLEATLTHPAFLAVETLQRSAAGTLESHLQTGKVRVLGLSPWLGGAEAGWQDGAAQAARFRGPAGMVRVGPADKGTMPLVIAEPGGNALRINLDGPGGRVQTFCGSLQGEPGLVNDWGRHARFNGPTYLAHRLKWDASDPGAWEVFVADTGNHAIRLVSNRGQVTTLAGTGQPGFQDGPGAQAQFNQPMGIACDPEGAVYVADRGNHRIRRISKDGEVSTLAGGEEGIADGIGAAVRFRALKGLAYVQRPGRAPMLVILDGHAVRWMNLESAAVQTLIGRVDAAGDRCGVEALDTVVADREARLNDPTDLLADPDPEGLTGPVQERLLIADTGNHGVKILELVQPAGAAQAPFLRLGNLAGDRRRAVTAPGLLRFDLPWFPDRDYATLAAPTFLADGGDRSALVADGPRILRLGLAEGSASTRLVSRPPVIRCGPAAAGAPCEAHFELPMEHAGAPGSQVFAPLDWCLDFLDPDGSLAYSEAGSGRGSTPIRVLGGFTAGGAGRLRLRVVTCEGLTTWGFAEVDIQGERKAESKAGPKPMDTSSDEPAAMDTSPGEGAGSGS